MNPVAKARHVVWLFASALLFAVAGCQSGTGAGLETASDTTSSLVGTSDGDLRVVRTLAPPPSIQAGRPAQLAENDLIEVDVFGVDELDREARIDERGFVSLPLIGEVRAAGLTTGELERALETSYGERYLQAPEISVFVKESIGQRVTLEGEFRQPGIHPVTTQTTLLQAVAQAGGLNDIANPNEVYVFRQYPTGKQVAEYSLTEIRRGQASDPRIYGGDVVVSFPSGARIAARNLREALGIATSATSLASPL